MKKLYHLAKRYKFKISTSVLLKHTHKSGLWHLNYSWFCTKVLLIISLILIIKPISFGQQNVSFIKPIDPKYVDSTFIDDSGRNIIRVIIPGSPPPKTGYLKSATLISSTAVILDNVPSFSWSFGCTPTSAAMIAGYYDRHGYSNIYAGPTNNGLCPMNNAVWGNVNVNGEIWDLCPLSASMKGLDGRTSRGHVEDYWVLLVSNQSDPYISNGWEEHKYEDCTGDFMKSSQSKFKNVDGATKYYVDLAGSPIAQQQNDDATFGFQQFIESRGYHIEQRYTQSIQGYNGNPSGFTFSNFKDEIDAGRPLMIHLMGHSMVGIGYESQSQTIYFYNTWDYAINSMVWGDSYNNMEMFAISVFELAGLSLSTNIISIACQEGSTAEVELGTSTTWTASSDQPWLTINPGIGSGSGKLTFTATANPNNSTRMATVTVSATNLESQIITITQQANSNSNSHFKTVWSGNGTDHQNIYAISAKLDNLDLENGDEIGVFDGTKCVGAGIIISTLSSNNLLNIQLSLDDGSGNGYTPGNDISYKFYDVSQNKEIAPIVANYINTDDSWNISGKFASGTSTFVELTCRTKVLQNITFNSGWNIFSTNVTPGNLDMKVIFQSLIDAGKLKKVMDESGKTLENFGAFGGWKNNIGNLNSSKGYKVNVTAPSTISLEGLPIQLPFEISLNTGWNIISYPGTHVIDAKILVQTLIDAGKLKKIMDETGKTIENFGAFGGWKNNIGNFLPGKGYKVNVTTNSILTIPADEIKSAIIVPEPMNSYHFRPVFFGNGTDHMNLHLVDLPNSGLCVGDEIGVFDGKLCVGVAMVGMEQLINGNISIQASANDELSEEADGFTQGHLIELKLFRNNKEYNLSPQTILNSQNLFETGESWFAIINIDQITALDEIASQTNVQLYPNPFSEDIFIEIEQSKTREIEVTIYDVNGKLVKTLYKGNVAGKKSFRWDGRNEVGVALPAGTYLCHVNHFVTKIILKQQK